MDLQDRLNNPAGFLEKSCRFQPDFERMTPPPSAPLPPLLLWPEQLASSQTQREKRSCRITSTLLTILGSLLQVIQRRDDYGEERENFNRDWDDYKSGFGDPEMEFWLGNENIYMLTNAEDYSLRVELEDFEGNVRSLTTSMSSLTSQLNSLTR